MRTLAERGVDGARSLLKERAQEDAELKARLDRLRERLRAQANRQVRHRLAEYDRRVGELTLLERRSDEEVARRIAELEERLRAARSADWTRGPPTMLLDDIQSALLVPDASWNRPPPAPGYWPGSGPRSVDSLPGSGACSAAAAGPPLPGPRTGRSRWRSWRPTDVRSGRPSSGTPSRA